MIQRIQTLYLFLASAALAMMFFLPIYSFNERQEDGSKKEVKINIQGRLEKAAQTEEFVLTDPNWARSLLTMVVGMGIFVAIFQYGNRKRQLAMSRVMIVANFALIIYLLSDAYKIVNSSGVESTAIATGYAVFMPTLSIVLTALAARQIKKDEELVKSADRLR